MFRLSYSLNSADLLPIEDVCDNLATLGYSGVELSFQYGQFDPFQISNERIEALRLYFEASSIKPVCISTATTKFLSEVPHEPSLINTLAEHRGRRATLIKRGIELAEEIGVPLVSFQSGYLRSEHASLTRDSVMQVLATEVMRLVKHIRGNVQLVIEPEPGMFIETIDDAHELIALVNDTRFGLHIDVGHVFCTEANYVEAIRANAKHARYMHIADIRAGFNLPFAVTNDLPSSSASAGTATLRDLGDGLYVFIDGATKVLLGEADALAAASLDDYEKVLIDRSYIEQHETIHLRHEILAYLDSVAGVEYDRALRAYNAIACLRLGNAGSIPKIRDTVCNTVNGKVHYHDLFGRGGIDYAAVISALIEGGYAGFCTVEMYNHASLWGEVAPSSAQFVRSMVAQHFGWSPATYGHIDHRTVISPYLRVADMQLGPSGDVAVLYDLRLTQPNTNPIGAACLHTLEHALLWLLPKVLPGFLSVAPMGCQTGLYIVTTIPLEREFAVARVIMALEQVATLDEVPYKSDALCGMAKNHDLPSAKHIITSVIADLKRNTLSTCKEALA